MYLKNSGRNHSHILGKQNYSNLIWKQPKKGVWSMVLFITVPPVGKQTLISISYNLFIRHGYRGPIRDGTAYFWSIQLCSNQTIRINGPNLFLQFLNCMNGTEWCQIYRTVWKNCAFETALRHQGCQVIMREVHVHVWKTIHRRLKNP